MVKKIESRRLRATEVAEAVVMTKTDIKCQNAQREGVVLEEVAAVAGKDADAPQEYAIKN